VGAIDGWIKLHRKMLDNPVVWKDSDHLAVWIYLLLNATHKDMDVLFKNKRITLKPGQLITSRKSIAKKLDISESKVHRVLKMLEIEQQIEQQTSNKNRLITIVGWNEYQSCEQQIEQQVNNNRTTSEQQVNTNKNIKNIKNNILCANFFEQIWQMYPNKRGKGQVSLTQKKKLYDIGLEEMTRAINRYKKDLANEPWRKPQNGSTFFNSGYVDYLDANYEDKPIQTAKPVQPSEIPEGWL
jgi:DNA-binding transcriptional regulator YhcF (GntR family)